MPSLIVRPEAEHDLQSAFIWYEKQRPGLGEDFLLRIEAAFESLLYDPFIIAPIHKDIRRKLIRRFPYGIYFFADDLNLCIIAVLHAKQHPKTWQRRV